MTDLPRPGRRSLLAMLTTLPAAMRAGSLLAAPPPPAAAPFAEAPRLLVAGPADGALNRWADALLPALEQSLPPDTAIRRIEIGSADGVTGANQFEARGAPDGQTVLLVSGQAALAWMVGDPRAQFDVAHWVPIMAGAIPGVVVGRPTVLVPDGRARTAAASPASFDLAALLGIQLLGARMEPVFGLVEPGAAQGAFAQGAVDAVLLCGQRVPEQFAALVAAGAQPLFTLGALDEAGRSVRDPTFPNGAAFRRAVRNALRQLSGRQAVRRLERHRCRRTTGLRADAAAAHAGCDGLAVAARRHGRRSRPGRAGHRRHSQRAAAHRPDGNRQHLGHRCRRARAAGAAGLACQPPQLEPGLTRRRSA